MNAKLVVALLVVAVGAFSATASADSVGCIICKKVAGLIKPNLENPNVAKAIAAGIEQACSKAPPNEQSQCKDALNKIVDVLRDGSPQEFCRFLTVCPANKPSVGYRQFMAAFGGETAECTVCKAILGSVKPNLVSLADAIVANADQACSLIPADALKACKEAMDQVANLLRNGTPQDLCALIGACKRERLSASKLNVNLQGLSEFFTDLAAPIRSHLARSAGQQCLICQQIAKKVIELLKQDKVEKAIVNGLGKVCASISKDAEKVKECTQIVTAYADQFIKAITEQDPALICTLLGQCQGLQQLEGVKLCEPCKEAVRVAKQYILYPSRVQTVRNLLNMICEYQGVDVDECKKRLGASLDKLVDELGAIEPKQVCHKVHLC